MSARVLAIAAATALAVGLPAHPAAADDELPDYDPFSEAWNGFATFKSLAEGAGFTVDIRTQLDWGELTANDIVFVIYPLARVEPGKLSSFVQAGGHAVVADDFGEGKDALAALGIIRADVVTPKASRYQDGQVWAPIARPWPESRGHELARDIDEVVTNYPAALTQVEGASVIVGFEDGSAVVVAGERGSGRFVAISDPSIFINRMLQYPGNVQLAFNVLRWLKREGRAHNIVLLRGEVSMFGDPPAFVDDPHGGHVARSVADLNLQLSHLQQWLLTPGAMKALAAVLAVLLLTLAALALPVRRGTRIDGAWLRFRRPQRRDEPTMLVTNADRQGGSYLVLASVLRDHVQQLLADALGKADPLYTLGENQLVQQLATAKGTASAGALTRVYKRLRALPSRSQAAAPWSTGHLARREFDALYRDVADLCRTLGAPLQEAPEAEAA